MVGIICQLPCYNSYTAAIPTKNGSCSLPFKPLPFKKSTMSLALLCSTPRIFGHMDAMLQTDWLGMPKFSR